MNDAPNNLKVLREERGYSLRQIAELCGKSLGGIYALEKPGANPTLNTAYAIAKVLDVDVTAIWPNTAEVFEETVTITVRRVVRT